MSVIGFMPTNIDKDNLLRFVRRKEHRDSDEILWGTFADLERKYSIPRSSGYVLIREGLIRSKLIRHKKQGGCASRGSDASDGARVCPLKSWLGKTDQ